MKTLRIGVIGLGVMGSRHLLAFGTCPTVEVVTVHDRTPENPPEHVPVATGLQELLAIGLDAVVVATPATTHRTVVEACLRAGVHVLVEKPLATTLADATDLRERAEAQSLVLAVGHVERFSPVLASPAAGTWAVSPAAGVSTLRRTQQPTRVTDVGALLDLGVHDVDLVRFLTGHEYVAATVTVTARLSDRRESAASIEAVLDDGTPVRHEIAWTTTGMGRSVTILPTADSVDSIDLGVANGSASLRAQAAAFVATCAGDRDPRLASAVDGLRAVEVVTGSLPELSSLRASNYA